MQDLTPSAPCDPRLRREAQQRERDGHEHGPHHDPTGPEGADPAMSPRKTGSVDISAWPDTKAGRMKLSDMPTTTRPPQSSMKHGRSHTALREEDDGAGTHTAAVPGTGRSAATAPSTPKTTTEGRPTSRKATPTRAP